jgi:xanthine dehydrogenase accessory factor
MQSVADAPQILAQAAAFLASGRRFALLTVVKTAGSTPRHAGAKMIVCADGELCGTIGGGALEVALVTEAQAALAERKPRLVRRHLTHELAMCCGGEVEVFIEPMGERRHLVLVGGGHVNRALAHQTARLGFELLVVDEVEEFARADRFPEGTGFCHEWEPAAWQVPFADETFIVIATRDHAVDQRVLELLAAAQARPAYLGVIGSRGKLGRFRRRLEQKGVAAEWIERVRGPIGLDIGAETPEEIAVAVAAELVAVSRGHAAGGKR